MTATEDKDNAFHGNTLWFQPLDEVPTGRGVAAPRRVYDFEVAMKAEGLTDLPPPAGTDPSRSARLLVTFDNDVHATKIPSRIQTLRLTRGTRVNGHRARADDRSHSGRIGHPAAEPAPWGSRGRRRGGASTNARNTEAPKRR